MIHSGILYQLDILYILFLWAIIVSDFLPLEIYKNLVFPLYAACLCNLIVLGLFYDFGIYQNIYFKCFFRLNRPSL